MDEIPDATDQAAAEEAITPEEKQVRECTEAVKGINAKCPTVYLTFKIPLQESVRDSLISKGFVVRYTLEYDSRKEVTSEGLTPYTCKVKITNPKLRDTSKDQLVNSLTNLFGKLSDNTNNAGDRAFYTMASGFLNDADIFCPK